MTRRPVVARFEQIHGRTVEVLHPDTRARLGVVGYTSKAAKGCGPVGWWFDLSGDERMGEGYATRDDAVRALRGLPVPEAPGAGGPLAPP